LETRTINRTEMTKVPLKSVDGKTLFVQGIERKERWTALAFEGEGRNDVRKKGEALRSYRIQGIVGRKLGEMALTCKVSRHVAAAGLP